MQPLLGSRTPYNKEAMQFLKSVKTTNTITLKVVSFLPHSFYWHSRQPTCLWNTLLVCLQCHDATWPFLSFHLFQSSTLQKLLRAGTCQRTCTNYEANTNWIESRTFWQHFYSPFCSRSLGNHDKMEEMKLIRKVWYLLNVHRQQQTLQYGKNTGYSEQP